MKKTISTRTSLLATVCLFTPFLAVAEEALPQETNLSGLEYDLIGRDDIYSYRALEHYSEAPFLTEKVAAGQLPPLAERLPSEPLVFKTDAMIDGTGEYGGVFRHVIGGRPEGWNWMAGQHQGWGGINMAIQECLVRQGPRWQVRTEDQTGPLPNLVREWSWNEDKTEVTMHLVEGIRWSDGDPFDTEDIRFWYDDNVQDENVASRMSAGSFADNAQLSVIDDYSFSFTFSSPQSDIALESLAYIQGCPGPSHVLKKHHPNYGGESYDAYTNVLPAGEPSVPVLGAWAPVEHKPDEIVILRRNPYYWKVDETGQQLPYFNEVHFKLSTWGDRTTQTVAGTADFSNMENPGNFVEALRQSQSDDSPVVANFGPRVLAWRINLNFGTKGVKDDVDRALRTLFRETDFRLALSYALDRDAIGQAVARGPFAHPYTGGFPTGSPYFTYENTIYQPFDQDKANALLDGLGLADTDGNGIRNLPDGGPDLQIDVEFNTNNAVEHAQIDAINSQLREVGVEILSKPVDKATASSVRASGAYNAFFERAVFVLPFRQTCRNLPIGDACPLFHQPDENGERVLLDVEKEIASAFSGLSSEDNDTRQAAADRMQRLMTENAYVIGTIQSPAALLVNKAVRNAHPGTPVNMFEWAEDAIIRERLWTPAGEQVTEILPGQIAEY